MHKPAPHFMPTGRVSKVQVADICALHFFNVGVAIHHKRHRFICNVIYVDRNNLTTSHLSKKILHKRFDVKGSTQITATFMVSSCNMCVSNKMPSFLDIVFTHLHSMTIPEETHYKPPRNRTVNVPSGCFNSVLLCCIFWQVCGVYSERKHYSKMLRLQ